MDIIQLQKIVGQYPEVEAAIRSQTGKPAADVAAAINHVAIELKEEGEIRKIATERDLPILNGRVVYCSESCSTIRIFCAD